MPASFDMREQEDGHIRVLAAWLAFKEVQKAHAAHHFLLDSLHA